MRVGTASCVHKVCSGLYLGSQFAAGYRDAMTGQQLEGEYLLKRLRQLNITHVLSVTAVAPLDLPGVTQKARERSPPTRGSRRGGGLRS